MGLHPGRLGALRRGMARLGCDLVALGPGDDLRYLCGWSPVADERLFLLLVATDRHALVVPRLNADAAATVPGPRFVYDDAEGPASALRQALASLGTVPGCVAVSDDLRADHLLALQQQLPGSSFDVASRLLAPLRACKDPSELEWLRRAARVADAGVVAALEACRPGVSEIQVAEAARAAMVASGAETVAFVLVASGPNTALPHHHSGPRLLQAGEPVLVDVGARVGGYCSDVTRMASLGQPSSRFVQVVEVVERALQEALRAARPGSTAADVDRAARRVIEDAGFGPYFSHRTGHGLGLSVHEPPSVHAQNAQQLEAGMVFTVEPGVYLPGEFGVRLEEAVILGPAGPQILSGVPRQVTVLTP